MTHLFKIQLQHSDMFIKELDIEKNMIRFQIRDKNNGTLMEAESYVPFIINEMEQKIEFGARFIAVGLANHIIQILN